jgi:hypothetical protein
MGVIGMRRRFIALTAACAVVLQMFLPFAALAAALPGSVICSSAGSSGNPGSHDDCSCAAGCGICSPHMPAVLPDVTTISVQPRIYAHRVSLLTNFQIATVRFAPQAARPPPFG